MGSYTYFVNEYIEIIDKDGLDNFFKMWDKYLIEYEKDNELNSYYSSKKMLKRDKENNEIMSVSFEKWDDIKLISYWYETTLVFLESIAKYIRGNVEFEFESNDECGEISFDDGECNLQTGVMSYTIWKPKDNVKMENINDKLKKIRVVNKL